MDIRIVDWFVPLMFGVSGLFSILFGRWHDKQLLKKMNRKAQGEHPQAAE